MNKKRHLSESCSGVICRKITEKIYHPLQDMPKMNYFRADWHQTLAT